MTQPASSTLVEREQLIDRIRYAIMICKCTEQSRAILFGIEELRLLDRALAAESQLERVRAETWQDIGTELENSVPFMEPVLLAIRGRKLPIAVFKHNAESPWRYLESGKEIEDNIIPTHWRSLPAPAGAKAS